MSPPRSATRRPSSRRGGRHTSWSRTGVSRPGQGGLGIADREPSFAERGVPRPATGARRRDGALLAVWPAGRLSGRHVLPGAGQRLRRHARPGRDGRRAHPGSLRRLRESGRRLMLVTGRELPDLQRVFPELELCDLAWSRTAPCSTSPGRAPRRRSPHRRPMPSWPACASAMSSPCRSGAASSRPGSRMETVVLETIRELGLELQITFNKGAVMVLPPGVNKATGLAAALAELGLSRAQCRGRRRRRERPRLPVRVRLRGGGRQRAARGQGDGRPGDRRRARRRGRRAGRSAAATATCRRRRTLAAPPRADRGRRRTASPLQLDPVMGSMLVAGVSGGGKSTKVAGVLEQLAAQGFQYLVVDPEGDYAELEGAVVLGDAEPGAAPERGLEILDRLDGNLVLNLLGRRARRPAGLPGRPAAASCAACAPGPGGRTGSSSTRRITCCRPPRCPATLPQELRAADPGHGASRTRWRPVL